MRERIDNGIHRELLVVRYCHELCTAPGTAKIVRYVNRKIYRPRANEPLAHNRDSIIDRYISGVTFDSYSVLIPHIELSRIDLSGLAITPVHLSTEIVSGSRSVSYSIFLHPHVRLTANRYTPFQTSYSPQSQEKKITKKLSKN